MSADGEKLHDALGEHTVAWLAKLSHPPVLERAEQRDPVALALIERALADREAWIWRLARQEVLARCCPGVGCVHEPCRQLKLAAAFFKAKADAAQELANA